ncbi:MAG: lipid-A-disaccharide synthase [Planctomycetota bacterium]|nr:MAG: lipid-A-disaccharide synthase [Planctomycetota bacterium]
MSVPDLFFSVGEPSGDLHAARVMQHLPASTRSSCRGFGGPQMAAQGCTIDYPLTQLAVVGFAEVLPKLREFVRVADMASDIFERWPPAGVVLVDFPGFNWHIAKRARQAGIPVLYYLPPQLWAWGGWRIKKMRKYVDHVLCALPIEYEWYAEHGMSCQYIGHPFFDSVAHQQLDAAFLRAWSAADDLLVAVLPGSRSREIRTIWPLQLEVIRELAARHRRVTFLVACLNQQHLDHCKSLLKPSDPSERIKFYANRTSEIIEVADCGLMKSGSVSLEMMARGTPSVVMYHVSRSTYEFARRVVHVGWMTLPNLIAGTTVMPEFLAVGKQCGPTIERTIAAMDRLLGDREERTLRKLELARLTRRFGQPGASARAAQAICQQFGIAHATALSTAPGLQTA